jgi:hypothetical protein
MLKKVLISALIAIGLVSGPAVRGETTSGDMGQRKTEKHGRRRGLRKKGGEQERPLKTTATRRGLNPQPLPPGIYSRRQGHRRRHRRHPN